MNTEYVSMISLVCLWLYKPYYCSWKIFSSNLVTGTFENIRVVTILSRVGGWVERDREKYKIPDIGENWILQSEG